MTSDLCFSNRPCLLTVGAGALPNAAGNVPKPDVQRHAGSRLPGKPHAGYEPGGPEPAPTVILTASKSKCPLSRTDDDPRTVNSVLLADTAPKLAPPHVDDLTNEQPSPGAESRPVSPNHAADPRHQLCRPNGNADAGRNGGSKD